MIFDYYLELAAALEFCLFVLLYLIKRDEHNYLDLQILALIASLVWPVSVSIVVIVIAAVISVIITALILKFITFTLDTTFKREPYKRPDNRTW